MALPIEEYTHSAHAHRMEVELLLKLQEMKKNLSYVDEAAGSSTCQTFVFMWQFWLNKFKHMRQSIIPIKREMFILPLIYFNFKCSVF